MPSPVAFTGPVAKTDELELVIIDDEVMLFDSVAFCARICLGARTPINESAVPSTMPTIIRVAMVFVNIGSVIRPACLTLTQPWYRE